MNSSESVHLSGYQARDYEVTDYQMYELAGTGLRFRGPEPGGLEAGRYFTCVGAAQTFGCFCDNPYPGIIERQFSLQALNLGYGGAGPEFYDRHPQLDDFINRSRFLVVQVMSGRSQSNSLYESGGLEYLTRRRDGQKVSAQTAYADLVDGARSIRSLPPRRLMDAVARRLAVPATRKIVGETRANWVESYRSFLSRIEVPKILLWFSKRTPDYPENFLKVSGIFGEFPQMIDRATLEQIKPFCDYYVECVSDRGSPQRLISRFDGKPVMVNPSLDRQDLGGELWTHDPYYPSPEMHEDAARALFSVVKGLVA